jgi:hypothetical protein
MAAHQPSWWIVGVVVGEIIKTFESIIFVFIGFGSGSYQD